MTAPTYHGLPLLKGPVWTWEVPVYFFIGGAAGGAAVIAVAAKISRADPRLVRDARRFAALGANLATPLLIADLGRPERFLNMLRVFKLQSPMSVGAWNVAAFGAASTATALADVLHRKNGSRGIRIAADSGAIMSALLGLGMMTYTGVLIGATAIPVWKQHVHLLPVHFGASALGSAVSLLELKGHRAAALNALGLGAAIFETLAGAAIEGRSDRESEPLRHGASGRLTRLGGMLSGPIPLALRVLGARKGAAISTLIGSLITRFAWIEAGKASAKDVGVAL